MKTYLYLQLQGVGEETDAEQLAELARQLRMEISDLPVEDVSPVLAGSAPAGTKSGDWAQAGTLAIALAPTVIPPLFELLKSWTARRTTIPVKLSLKVGDRQADIEYDPATTKPEQISSLVKKLETSLSGK